MLNCKAQAWQRRGFPGQPVFWAQTIRPGLFFGNRDVEKAAGAVSGATLPRGLGADPENVIALSGIARLCSTA